MALRPISCQSVLLGLILLLKVLLMLLLLLQLGPNQVHIIAPSISISPPLVIAQHQPSIILHQYRQHQH